MIRISVMLIAVLSWQTKAQSQELTLDSAWQLARSHYPVLRDKLLIQKTAQLTLSNLQKGFLPQFTLSGQATYQSDVTRVPVSLPGFQIESPAKDQYKVLADVNQLLYDGGQIKQQKLVQAQSARVEEEKVEVELHQLHDRINQVYLGILYLDQQLRQVDLVKADIQSGINRVQAQLEEGVAFRSSVAMLKAEWLKADQRAIDMKASREGWLQVLSLLTGRELNAETRLTEPVASAITTTSINRPELRLFNSQQILADQQKKMIHTRTLPKLSLFAQGGYGRPGLNMLLNEFDFYYIGGIRFNWSLGSLYTVRKEKQQADISKQRIAVQQDIFMLNTQTQLTQQQAEIKRLEQLLQSDASIIELRQSVTESARAQLDNNVITANDYLKEVNAEDQARQSAIMHRLQLLQARINYQTISGQL
ncbi:MAG: TolC family protein [Sphingobacteriales bacterium]|nr:TolC family protein [Sphingobacteriales bacterium]OJW33699.1 MAG: transporter [Sphingobacteriales bacterium 46-32]